MPGPAADGGKAPFRSAREDVRAGVGAEGAEGGGSRERPGERRPRQDIVWRNVVLMSLLHLGAVYSLLLIPKAQPLTLLWAYFCFLLTALGVTAGAHRLWSHRSYKAKLPLRIFLAVANSMAFQLDIMYWARKHINHHVFTRNTSAIHNVMGGRFFSHCTWLFFKQHRILNPLSRARDQTHVLMDPRAILERRYYKISVVLMCFVVPTLVPWGVWGESLWNSYFLASILRYTVSLNVTWLVNSAAHMYGNRPYDRHISPRQNPLVTLGAIGEGFHNYHHTFPFDYSASELGLNFNPTTWFIDFMCWLGLATDRKRATKLMIEARKARTGDGSA
uniref:Stearoyl-CoA desaturase 5 n=1 Tax=Sus scrofa TaxID=9823 RepID=A0A8D0VBE9_PIG